MVRIWKIFIFLDVIFSKIRDDFLNLLQIEIWFLIFEVILKVFHCEIGKFTVSYVSTHLKKLFCEFSANLIHFVVLILHWKGDFLFFLYFFLEFFLI